MEIIKYLIEGEDAQITTDFRNQISFFVENLSSLNIFISIGFSYSLLTYGHIIDQISFELG